MAAQKYISVWDLHKHEISEYEQRFGKLAGRLFYAMCILSDVQELSDDEAIKQEINEVKELISSVMRELEKNQVLKNKKLSQILQVRLIGTQQDIDNFIKVISAGLETTGFKFSNIKVSNYPARKKEFRRVYVNIR